MKLEEKSIYSFCFTKKQYLKYNNNIELGAYKLYYNENTKVQCFSFENREFAIIGDIVWLGEESLTMEEILHKAETKEDLISLEYYCGGKYIIFFRNKDKLFVMGDATCSVPLYYTQNGGEIICASNIQTIAQKLNIVPDEELMRIREHGQISQAMPYDYTIYKEIKQLIPNHILDVEKCCTERFVNSIERKKCTTAKKAATQTAPLIKKLVDYYTNNYKLACAITGGRDSRVVLAFLHRVNNHIPCYTIKHKEHGEKEADLLIPMEMAQKTNINYKQIEDIDVSEKIKEKIDSMLGENLYSERTLKIVNTIKHYFEGYAVVNGDIIGQIGKCSLHGGIPKIFATASYFNCKMHNYSCGAVKKLREWIKDIKASGEKIDVFDLFSVENRLGRWAAQRNEIYNLLGLSYINIFNSRSIIYVWSQVDKRERTLSKIHSELIKEVNAQFISFSYKDEKDIISKIAKSNWLFYYISIRIKHLSEKVWFLIKKIRKRCKR